VARQCWQCGADQKPTRPLRGDFDSEPEYLVAALTWLDFTFPKRVAYKARIAEWERLERERDPKHVRARLVALLDDPDVEAAAEFARLAEIYKNLNRTTQQGE
jgi:hypothetical protein